MVCITLNVEHRKLKSEQSWKLRKDITEQLGKGKDYKVTSKQLDVSVTTAAQIILRFKVHRTEDNLPGPQEENWWQIKETDKINCSRRAQSNFHRC